MNNPNQNTEVKKNAFKLKVNSNIFNTAKIDILVTHTGTHKTHMHVDTLKMTVTGIQYIYIYILYGEC